MLDKNKPPAQLFSIPFSSKYHFARESRPLGQHSLQIAFGRESARTSVNAQLFGNLLDKNKPPAQFSRLFVITLPIQNGESAINLFQKHNAEKVVREGHG